jgi:hypothetical protein
MANTAAGFPAMLDIEYPDRELNRVTTLFRPIVAIPIGIILALVDGPTLQARSHRCLFGGGVVFLATALLLVFRQKYPRWWFDWSLALTKFSIRVAAYLALLGDEYPSVDEEQAVHVDIPYPRVTQDLNRWLPLVKWLLAVPHYIVLMLLGLAAAGCVVVAWFAILFTGRYPRSLFDIVVGVLRWGLRVTAYAFLLTTDRYPPFTLTA